MATTDLEAAEFLEKFTEDQQKNFRETFDKYDKDGEGSIAATQLGKVLRECGQVPTEAWLKEHKVLADKEETGKIQWIAFTKILTLIITGNKKDDNHLMEAFRKFDPDVTGYITCEDMRHVLTTIGDVLDAEEVEEFLTDADPLCQGTINYEAMTRTLVDGPD